MSQMKIIVKDGRKKTYTMKKWLLENNYIFKKTGKYTSHWEKYGKESFLREEANFLNKNKVQAILIEDVVLRSSNYRKIFFDNNKGLFKTGIYMCSYCGKPMKKKKTTVDHLFPISKAQKSRFITWFIKRSKIESINDKRNLVPACKRCNALKSSKTGFWLPMGLIGRHPFFWVILWVVIFLLVVWFMFGNLSIVIYP